MELRLNEARPLRYNRHQLTVQLSVAHVCTKRGDPSHEEGWLVWTRDGISITHGSSYWQSEAVSTYWWTRGIDELVRRVARLFGSQTAISLADVDVADVERRLWAAAEELSSWPVGGLLPERCRNVQHHGVVSSYRLLDVLPEVAP